MSSPTRWLNDDEQHLWRLLLSSQWKLSRAIEESVQQTSNLSYSEFGVLVELSEAENRTLRLRDLCMHLEWDRSRASHQVTRMEKRGLVTKEPSPGDGRGVLVTLTDEGFSRLEAAVPEHVEVVRRMVFDHMKPSSAPVLEEFFSGIIAVREASAQSEVADADGD
ncbi:MarR family protein [Corynebacterium glaucum]|uniref:MarR family protein n=1 Tax=Corynebacterium glaucum TaxID=187491 RepID=A0A1Q2HVW2_9CORY|nr:MarR family transcriptional regulator [Corynebacterium glaucum]AQQ14996.1 MarR family protein [Corynebacterium glaucum]